MSPKPASSKANPPPAYEIGVGLGLRPQHYKDILETRPAISWFEAISENYLGFSESPLGGRPIEILERIRRDYPIVLHGVSMSLGSVDDLDLGYMHRLKALITRIEPEWISDHLCWTGVDHENLHDLLPLPYTEEALRHLTHKIKMAQDILGRRLAVENVSTYLSFRHSEMSEWEFLKELSERADCHILLDINNVYVSAINLGFDPMTYLKSIPAERIAQIHLAGHSRAQTPAEGTLLIDTHDQPVPDPVWDLYAQSLRIHGEKPTLIEWDANIPEFSVLATEAHKASRLRAHEPSRPNVAAAQARVQP